MFKKYREYYDDFSCDSNNYYDKNEYSSEDKKKVKKYLKKSFLLLFLLLLLLLKNNIKLINKLNKDIIDYIRGSKYLCKYS